MRPNTFVFQSDMLYEHAYDAAKREVVAFTGLG
jgi:hypothetical protein